MARPKVRSNSSRRSQGISTKLKGMPPCRNRMISTSVSPSSIMNSNRRDRVAATTGASTGKAMLRTMVACSRYTSELAVMIWATQW